MSPTRPRVEVGEQLGSGEAPMPSEHRVRVLAAHRQGGPLQVADALAQHLVAGAVVDGKVGADRRDHDAPHEPRAVGGQEPVVRVVARHGFNAAMLAIARGTLPALVAADTLEQAAVSLCVTVPTAKSHVHEIYARLGVADRAAALAEGRRRGLI